MKYRLSFSLRYMLLLLSTAFLCGCGGDSNVGAVNGTLTLDGKPVSDALVSFSPKNGGSPSAAKTDSSGKYSLQYTRELAGAVVGEHSVKITTYQAANADSDPPRTEVPEKIPLKYNFKTELIKEVKQGSNTIDLELKLDGPVIQPKELEKIEAQRELKRQRDC